ncbi:hypothetical protein KGF57_000184 [Candida theae]|uniref:FCP1 homology domain-containing protein n=1 Tax=Candida theae TaxID=1198502 RepID=A0AAD5G103_9ASCO|nr:uncharacterized protein KGF57_000184 [Candida theae]KAI5968490.1 hypothetical protein KGF57_000184 [Candida theae]
MGVLSLFCCSDTSEESSDRRSQQPVNGQNRQQQNKDISRTSNTSLNKQKPQHSKANGTSMHHPTTATDLPIDKKEHLVSNGNTISHASAAKLNGDKKEITDDDESTIEPSSNNRRVSAGDIIAQASPNEQPIPTPNEQPHPQPMDNDDDDDDDDDDDEIDTDIDDFDDIHSNAVLDLKRLQTGQAHDPETGCLLGPSTTEKKCLVLDLDETLVHSSFKYLRSADFVIPVEIDGQVHHVYVIKRPGVDEFLEKVGKLYEVVVFTASVAKYGDPLLNKLDFSKSVYHRLYRDSCYNYQGNFIKNLSQLGRKLQDTIIIDNSPQSYLFHPSNAVPISSWFSDSHDNELLDLLPFLEDLSKPNVDDVELVLDTSL